LIGEILTAHALSKSLLSMQIHLYRSRSATQSIDGDANKRSSNSLAQHNVFRDRPKQRGIKPTTKKGQHFSAQQHAYCLARFTCYRQSVSARTRVDHSTRSQVVARIADRTASQHPWESREVGTLYFLPFPPPFIPLPL